MASPPGLKPKINFISSRMRGTTVDYVREGLNSLLRFGNPNAKDYCGCGESFSIEPEVQA